MFELSDELVRQIIFAMENQNNWYVIDTELGVLTKADTLDPEERPHRDSPELDVAARYQPLPGWTSADGFQLMERFLSELHNPIVRNNLQEILLSGKRVFRRFKDTIREYPEVEKRYYRFKFIEMRKIVREWYAVLRELAGLDSLEVGADQELDDMVLTDLTVAPLREVDTAAILVIDRQAFMEGALDLPSDLREHLYRRRRECELPSPDGAGSLLLGAYNPLEELCGLLWAVEDASGDPSGLEQGPRGSLLEIVQVFVVPEYRGLGVATSLVDDLLREARDRGSRCVISRLPGTSVAARALMRTLEFREMRSDYLIDLGDGPSRDA